MNLLLWNGIHSIVSCIGMEKSNNQDMDLVSTWLNFHSHDPTYSITSILFLFQQKSNGSNWFLLFTCKKNQCSIWIHFTTCIAKVNFSIFSSSFIPQMQEILFVHGSVIQWRSRRASLPFYYPSFPLEAIWGDRELVRTRSNQSSYS